MKNSVQILQEEINNPNSTLVQAGDNRVRMVNEMVRGIRDTLTKLEKLVKKYHILDSGTKYRQLWLKFKWSAEFSSIDSLWNKVCDTGACGLDKILIHKQLVYHNTVMSLLLTSIGKFVNITRTNPSTLT